MNYNYKGSQKNIFALRYTKPIIKISMPFQRWKREHLFPREKTVRQRKAAPSSLHCRCCIGILTALRWFLEEIESLFVRWMFVTVAAMLSVPLQTLKTWAWCDYKTWRMRVRNSAPSQFRDFACTLGGKHENMKTWFSNRKGASVDERRARRIAGILLAIVNWHFRSFAKLDPPWGYTGLPVVRAPFQTIFFKLGGH